MALDKYAQQQPPVERRREGPLFELLPDLLAALGPAWVADDERYVGMRLQTGGFACDLEDMGYGVLQITCVMPRKELPGLSMPTPFGVGAQEIALLIVHRLMTSYALIVAAPEEHRADEQAWEHDMQGRFTTFGELTRITPTVETERDPGLRMSAVYRRGTGDSLRIDAAPNGGAVTATIHVPDEDALGPLVMAWRNNWNPPAAP